MVKKPTAPELLAPAGNWEALEAAVTAGADAVYLGGKRFNMRLHRSDANFDNEQLARACDYVHAHGAKLYITVNNLLSERELPSLRSYLAFLEEIAPDSLIIQDLAVLQLAREMALTIPLHASVMMNIHNEAAVRTLQEYGITRVVFNREMSLDQLAYIRQRTGIEVEYFIHGDMCVAQSGQCLHSGILFGQSSNRGRCLKPCRWPYSFAAGDGSQTFADPGPYKLAMKDMCLYLHLPQLIAAGVASFKIEGRMRTPDFVGRVVGLYRQAIDRYTADPAGYIADEAAWKSLHETRVRDYTTCYAFGNPGGGAIGFGGEREPRFFSQAVKEPDLNTPVAPVAATEAPPPAVTRPQLTVRVADLASLRAAYENGADIAYVGGEAFKPAPAWTLPALAEAAELASQYNASLVVTTPRITTERECRELEQFLAALADLKLAGIMVSNIGSLRQARQLTDLPLHADFSFSLLNSAAAAWLKNQGVIKATASLEAPAAAAADIAASGVLPLEVIVHGTLEAMVMDFCLPKALSGDQSAAGLCRDLCAAGDFALGDSAGQQHKVTIDQYCRNHILFARDLCLLTRLEGLYAGGVAYYRIEGQHYRPELVGRLTAAYRRELDRLAGKAVQTAEDSLDEIIAASPRPLGIGVFRHRASR